VHDVGRGDPLGEVVDDLGFAKTAQTPEMEGYSFDVATSGPISSVVYPM